MHLTDGNWMTHHDLPFAIPTSQMMGSVKMFARLRSTGGPQPLEISFLPLSGTGLAVRLSLLNASVTSSYE